jgi:hypothetical protein
MPRNRLLIDSNSYFRLAKSIHPLLGAEFGHSRYILLVLKDLDDEYFRSSRLHGKFSWVDDPPYRLNRRNNRGGAGKEAAKVERAAGVIRRYSRTNGIPLSHVDVSYLAYSSVLRIPVVTDDEPMIEIAKVHGILCMKTVELLALMLECGHVNLPKVREIAGFLAYDNDLPRNFASDYAAHFKEPMPPSE